MKNLTCGVGGVACLPKFVADALTFKVDDIFSFLAASPEMVGCPLASVEYDRKTLVAGRKDSLLC